MRNDPLLCYALALNEKRRVLAGCIFLCGERVAVPVRVSKLAISGEYAGARILMSVSQSRKRNLGENLKFMC